MAEQILKPSSDLQCTCKFEWRNLPWVKKKTRLFITVAKNTDHKSHTKSVSHYDSRRRLNAEYLESLQCLPTSTNLWVLTPSIKGGGSPHRRNGNTADVLPSASHQLSSGVDPLNREENKISATTLGNWRTYNVNVSAACWGWRHQKKFPVHALPTARQPENERWGFCLAGGLNLPQRTCLRRVSTSVSASTKLPWLVNGNSLVKLEKTNCRA